jgi:DNA-binding transcriptional LysR family regulator
MIVEDMLDARLLVELGKRLSFSDVARRLAIPPATASRRLARMEKRAGLRLFERTTRTVAATPAGTLAIAHAERMLLEGSAIDASIAAMHKSPVGVVRLTTPVIFGQALLGPIIVRFIQRYPKCDLQVDLTDRHLDLAEERLDLAVRIGPVVDESLVARPLGTVRAGLYRRAGLPAPSFEQLAQGSFGLLAVADPARPSLNLTSEGGEQHCLAVRPRIVCLNPWLLRTAALETDLIVVLPDVVAAADVRDGRLVRVATEWSARNVQVAIVFPSRRPLRAAVRGFLEIAQEVGPALLRSASATNEGARAATS